MGFTNVKMSWLPQRLVGYRICELPEGTLLRKYWSCNYTCIRRKACDFMHTWLLRLFLEHACCTLMKCLWCADHTCRGVRRTACEGSYCKFWLPWSPWHGLPLRECCEEREGYVLLFDGPCRQKNLSLCNHPPLVWVSVRTVESMFSAAFLTEWEAWTLTFRSSLLIHEAVSASAARKSWLSAPPGKCWSVRHIFIARLIPYCAADWEELHDSLPSPKAVWLISLLNACAGSAQVSVCERTCLKWELWDRVLISFAIYSVSEIGVIFCSCT